MGGTDYTRYDYQEVWFLAATKISLVTSSFQTLLSGKHLHLDVSLSLNVANSLPIEYRQFVVLIDEHGAGAGS